MEMSTEKAIVTNENGKVIATIHGNLNIETIANFFIKTTVKKDIGQIA